MAEPGNLHTLRVDAALKSSQFGYETVWADYPDEWDGYKCSVKQWPVVSQLEALLEAAQIVAAAIEDNANEEKRNLHPRIVANYSRRLQSISMRIALAGAASCGEDLSSYVPSMTPEPT